MEFVGNSGDALKFSFYLRHNCQKRRFTDALSTRNSSPQENPEDYLLLKRAALRLIAFVTQLHCH